MRREATDGRLESTGGASAQLHRCAAAQAATGTRDARRHRLLRFAARSFHDQPWPVTLQSCHSCPHLYLRDTTGPLPALLSASRLSRVPHFSVGHSLRASEREGERERETKTEIFQRNARTETIFIIFARRLCVPRMCCQDNYTAVHYIDLVADTHADAPRLERAGPDGLGPRANLHKLALCLLSRVELGRPG